MTRLTKAIKTDIKDLIRDKAINPKELALEAKKRDFLLKAFWGQISKYDYQAWKTLPSVMYKTVTYTARHLQVSDRALGQLDSTFNKEISHPHHMNRWMTYESLPTHLKNEFKDQYYTIAFIPAKGITGFRGYLGLAKKRAKAKKGSLER